MTTFNDRERGEEARFRHDQELGFKVRNRRNKLFGLWLADEYLGLTGDKATDYAKDVVMADFEEAGDDDVFRKIRKDFDAKGVKLPDEEIRGQMHQFLAQAVAEIKTTG